MRLSIRYILVVLTGVVILINLLLFLYSSRSTALHWLRPTRHTAPSRIDALQGKPHEHLQRTSNYRASKYTASKFRALLDLMPESLRGVSSGLPVTIAAEEFRTKPGVKTGNPLIDSYGSNDRFWAGENGRGVTFIGDEQKAAAALQREFFFFFSYALASISEGHSTIRHLWTHLVGGGRPTEKLSHWVKRNSACPGQREFNVNVMASDVIPPHRMVPDSRLKGCSKLTYDESSMPRATIIVPFYDEWPSVLLRTVYSVVNRTPGHLLQEILLIDDHSTMEELKDPLDDYIQDHFPRDLVRVLRMPKREGLIRARMRGWEKSKGEVVVFFDSHMEVNIDWLQPLLAEIQKDRRTVPMAALDYVNQNTLEYRYYDDYIVRYGFDWRLVFFETFFRQDQIGATPLSARPGATMVGAAFAMDQNYFRELGGYDTGMKVWGGENLEMAWRVWMCGGRLVHVPCSHIGHIARSQPYPFPEGRQSIEEFNYKRALMVWMDEPYRQFVFDAYPDMEDLDVGDLSERYALREKLQCRNFTWYLDNVWPELAAYDRDVTAWGSLKNRHSQKCLDNYAYLFQAPAPLYVFHCHYQYNTQGFSLTQSGLLRTTLQCVVVKQKSAGQRPMLEDCIIGPRDKWVHTQEGRMVHVESQLCLDEDGSGPVMMACSDLRPSQLWTFTGPPRSLH